MKYIGLVVLILLATTSFGKNPTIEEVRGLFKKAPDNEKACKELIALLAPYHQDNNALYLGFKGVATMILAKHTSNPLSKLSNFKQGKTMLENAISADKANVELRFLRLSVQNNAPGFLNYNDKIKQDKEFLTQAIPTIKDRQLKKSIMEYLQTQSKK